MSTYFRYGRITLPATDQYLVSSLVECGDYCFAEWMTYEALIEPGATVVDVGANIGAMSIFFARRVGPTGRIVALEPCPFTHCLLVENARLNGLATIDAHRVIAGAENGEGRYIDPYVEAITSMDFGTLSVRSTDKAGWGRMVPTRTLALDDLGLDRCDFLKIDVEGQEAAVVEGARKTIVTHRPVVSLEIGGGRGDLAWFDRLLAQGYRIHVFLFRVFTTPNFKNRPIDDLPPAVAVQAVCAPPGRDLPERVRRHAFRALPDRDALDGYRKWAERSLGA